MYSDNGSLCSRSLQYWPMEHCVRNTTSRRSVFEKLRNSEMTFLIIVSLKSGKENSIIQELSAEADRIIGNRLLPAKSRWRKNLIPHLHKTCFISWHNLFMKHFKFVSWQSGGPSPVGASPLGRTRASPLDPTGAAPRTSPSPSTSTPSPVLPTTRMPAIIAVTQAANFHVLIGWNSIRTSKRKRSCKLA